MTDPIVHRLIDALRPKYTGEQLDDLIPFLVLSAGGLDGKPSPKLVQRMDAFFRKSGVDPKASPEKNQAAIDAYFKAHPPDRGMLAAVEEILGGAELDESEGRASAGKAAIGGSKDKRPAGGAGAGFKLGGLAQFALQGAMDVRKPPPDGPRVDERVTPPNREKELM